MAWIGGEATDVMESLPLDEIKSTLTKYLRTIIGDPSLPPPINIQRTQWVSNPYTCGSYTYCGFGAELPKQFDDLAEPIMYGDSQRPILLFAGEATHSYAHSTVHGARWSGLREAERLIQHYNLSPSSKL